MSPRLLVWLPSGVGPCCADQVTLPLTFPYRRVWSRQRWDTVLSLLPAFSPASSS